MHLEESERFPPHVCMQMSGLDNSVALPSFIIKNFRCKGINRGSRSGFRITFLFDKNENKFTFIEFFQKNKKDIPNKDRINELFKKDVKIIDELYEDEEKYLNSD